MSSATLTLGHNLDHNLDARRIKALRTLSPAHPYPRPARPTRTVHPPCPRGAHPTARTRWLQVPPQLLELAAEQLPLQRHGLGHEVVAGEAGPRLVVPQVRVS